ncbi:MULTISPECIES: hypothetical protein [Flavobacterium]|uniref:Phage protein n=1 Tax=Flavobacterium keumense TaxID=1306518 RepID=A0ABY8N4G7_9FLAO|nr:MULTISPECIES: hypothetical protein [Flavobacterium]WGK93751.1 hypothetical protein MG292_06520 [Flavobacterium keumense]
MEKFKGTPGPWRVDVNIGHQEIETINIIQINGGITPAKITRFSPYEIPREVRHANAQLIAAAPELLEALILVLDTWGEDYKDKNNPEGGGSPLWEKINSVIKKATEL